MKPARRIKLGLIGDNISASRAPDLHRIAGDLSNLTVQYDRLVPRDMSKTFDEIFAACPALGYNAINVTYPYKERAIAKVTTDDPLVRAIAAINTVVFANDMVTGFNTDYSGFVEAYKKKGPNHSPGICCLVGTGGVGRALAFGLITVGAEEIRLLDRDQSKSQQLANDLNALGTTIKVQAMSDINQATAGCDGLLNGTPVGMLGYPGSPFTASQVSRATWVFDAVYTPMETDFLKMAQDTKTHVISGYELFFYQGVHAWRHFSGVDVDEQKLRAAL